MKRPSEDSLPDRSPIRVRHHGDDGPCVVVLHGGPAAAGSMAPVARGLAGTFRVVEPLQRGSGGNPLSVELHVADLHRVIESHRKRTRVLLVGHSWGGMLALAYASEHPDRVSGIVVIGCGTFDRASRKELQTARDRRMNESLRRRMATLPADVPDPDARLEVMAELMLPVHSHDLLTFDQEVESFDMAAHGQTWSDMLRLQDQGVYPAAFEAIDAPVLMLHGTVDPHPGRMIRDSLAAHLRRLEYREWDRCGHYPWMERAVREEFFSVLTDWLLQHAEETS